MPIVEKDISGRRVLLLIAGIIAVQCVVGTTIYFMLPSWQERGTFGDMFGAVNALFSGLALAGVIYAILLQRAELALQRQELELTRVELAKAATAQEHSAGLLREQLDLARSSTALTEAYSLAQTAMLLRLAGGTGSGESFTAAIENIGGLGRDIEVTPEGPFKVVLSPRDLFPAGTKGQLAVRNAGDLEPPYYFGISYLDSRGRMRKARFMFDPHVGALKTISGQP